MPKQEALKLKQDPTLITRRDRRDSMSDWAKRLQRLQADLPATETESVDHLSLEVLQNEKVKFGKAHLGKSYAELWETAPEWVKWFLVHYQGSSNVEHKKVIRYIKLKIEEGETQGASTTQLPVRTKAKAAPKSLITTRREGPPPHPDAAPEEPWINQEENALEARMTNLENALHQILVHLTPSIPNTIGSTAMSEDLPELPLASEWEDPWTA
jgi:hypothetical protein